MLMEWAGRVHDRLCIGDVYLDDAVNDALQAAELTGYFRERTKNGTQWLVSRSAFEQQFALRVRIKDNL